MHSGGLELALVLLLAAVIAVPVFKKFGFGAVLGYLAVGVVLAGVAHRSSVKWWMPSLRKRGRQRTGARK